MFERTSPSASRFRRAVGVLSLMLILFASTLSGCTSLGGPATPRAKLIGAPNEIQVGDAVNLDARTSTTPNPSIIVEYRWDFGDGRSATTLQGFTSHIYFNYGTYTVKVTVVNDEGGEDSTTWQVFVNGPPVIQLDLPEKVKAGKTLYIDAGDSADPEGAPLSFSWDLDLKRDTDNDGDPRNDVDHIGSNWTHHPSTSGELSGMVTVTDDKGASNSTIWEVQITPRTYRVDWEERVVRFNRAGHLEEGEEWRENHIPSSDVILISVEATLALSQDTPPLWPQDNFTLRLNVPSNGWSEEVGTSADNISKNATATIERYGLNIVPEQGIIHLADSMAELMEELLDHPDSNNAIGTWYWFITADNCDPDSLIDELDPDTGNDWSLDVEFTVMVPHIIEVN